MIITVLNTATGEEEKIPMPWDSFALQGALLDVHAAKCTLTLTHTPGKLSHFAITHQTLGDFDWELFNGLPELPLVMPYYLAALLHRFSPLRFERWRTEKVA